MAKSGKDATYTRRINLYINGKEVQNNVASIRKEMRKLIASQNNMVVGSEKYNKTGQKIIQLNAILKKHRDSLYKTGEQWHYAKNSIGDYKKRLEETRKSLESLEVGSERYNKKLKEYHELSEKLKQAESDKSSFIGNKNSIAGIENEMQKLIAAQKKMTIGSTEYVNTGKKIKELDATLKQHKQEIYGTTTRWGLLSDKVKAFKTIAVAAIGTAVAKVFGTITKKSREFEDALSSLSSITGATGRDLSFYSDEAIRLGQASTQSATQVVKAMELIGSAKPDLLKNKEALAEVTEQTIVLAEAAGLSMPEASKALTQAMNQFSLPASESAKLINVLAAGSKEGAAAIPDITSAILKFGTVANSANISVEESVGLIETLAEKGIVGSEAGTNLRNVLLELQKGADDTNPAVVGLSTALKNLAEQNLSSAEMTERFGKENVVAAKILTENADMVERYTKSVTGTSVAYEQQIKQTNNLSGAWTKFLNKVNALILGISQNSNFTGFLASIVRGASKVVDVFTAWTKTGIEKKIREEQKEVNILASRLTDANTTTEERRKLLEKLRDISPTIVKGLEAENLNYSKLQENIKAYNKELTNRIIIANLQEEEEKAMAELAQARVSEAKQWLRIQTEMVKINQEIALSEGTREEKLNKIIDKLKEEVKLQEEAGIAGERTSYTSYGGSTQTRDTRTKEQKDLEKLLTYRTWLNNAIKERNELEEKTANYSERVAQLREILGLNQQIEEVTNEANNNTFGDDKTSTDEQEEIELKALYERKRELEEQLAEEIKKIRRELELDAMSEQERERALIEEKYNELQEEAEQHEFWEDYKKDVTELKQKEIAAHEEKWNKKRLDSRRELEEKIQELLLEGKEKEEAAIRKKFTTVIEEAEKAGLATEELYKKMQEEIDALDEDGRDALGQTPDKWEELHNNLRTAMQYIDQIGSIWSSINQIQSNKEQQAFNQYEENIDAQKQLLNDRLEEGLISQEQYNARVANLDANLEEKREEMAAKQAEREKRLRIFEATINTAAAVVEALPNIPLSILVGAAGAAQIAAIASEPLPEYAEGGYTRGDRIYRAGEKGREWIASNDMLMDPYTGPIIRMLEDIRQRKVPSSIFAPAQPNVDEIKKSVPAFEKGGYTNIAPAIETPSAQTTITVSDTETIAAMKQMAKDMRELKAFMSDPRNRQAVINYNTLKRQTNEDDLRGTIGKVK
ncbi:phage tail tape measure protein [Thermophagus sp. OGC60D27]|uniref:phage tail tape measure protein n=1 Tax=Thermophagus sp. OGC60D27 TaxID=3458415 RepID=UPI004037FFC0